MQTARRPRGRDDDHMRQAPVAAQGCSSAASCHPFLRSRVQRKPATRQATPHRRTESRLKLVAGAPRRAGQRWQRCPTDPARLGYCFALTNRTRAGTPDTAPNARNRPQRPRAGCPARRPHPRSLRASRSALTRRSLRTRSGGLDPRACWSRRACRTPAGGARAQDLRETGPAVNYQDLNRMADVFVQPARDVRGP